MVQNFAGVRCANFVFVFFFRFFFGVEVFRSSPIFSLDFIEMSVIGGMLVVQCV